MSNLEDLINDIIKQADSKIEDEKLGTVLQRIPVTPEQRALYDEGIKCMEEVKTILEETVLEKVAKANALRKKFWADIELQSGVFTKQMRYKPEENVVIVFEPSAE